MTYDPRKNRVSAIKQMIKQNPYIANSNSMIRPLYDELVRLEAEVEKLQSELAKARAPKKSAPRKEKTDGDASTE